MDIESNVVAYFAPVSDESTAQAEVDTQTGIVIVVPSNNCVGTVQVMIGVRAGNGVANDTVGGQDTQVASVQFQSNIYSWTNQTQPPDVDGDGVIAPVDALMIINRLNTPEYAAQGGHLAAERTPAEKRLGFLDTEGDGYVAPQDALIVINRMNPSSVSAGESGEGEASLDEQTAHNTNDFAIVTLFANSDTFESNHVIRPLRKQRW